MKKLPSQLSNEELLKQIEQRPKEEEREITSEDYKNDVLGFATFFQIERGDEYIRKSRLYRIYTQWSKEPVSRNQFTYDLSVFIPACEKAFYVNQKALKLSALAHKLFVAHKSRYRTKSPLLQRSFNNFLKTFNIKKGTTAVPLYSLLHFYLENGTKKMNLSTFWSFCKLHFKVRQTDSSHRWILLDSSIFEVLPRERMLSIFESKLLELAQKAQDKKTKKQVSEPGPDAKPKDPVRRGRRPRLPR